MYKPHPILPESSPPTKTRRVFSTFKSTSPQNVMDGPLSSPPNRQEKKDKEWRRIVKALALIEAFLPLAGRSSVVSSLVHGTARFVGRRRTKKKWEGSGGGF